MIAAAALPDEACRLAALHELNVLDTPPEERFDRITRLARRLFDVPIALVSLVDADRQWFKSRQGLDAPETPRAISFCGHTLAQGSTMVVPDAAEDPRFHDNPLVVGDPRIRFYAGYPLRGRGGYLLGTLCLIDRRPRTLSDEDLEVLADLAATVEAQLTQAQTATGDELTGLINRRGLTVVGEYVIACARRSGAPVSVLFFDLNGFKQINDTLGHAIGDQALIAFAGALSFAFRESDIVARLSGDEFCAVLSGTAPVCADALLHRLDGYLTELNRREPFTLRYSVGVVPFNPTRHRSLADVLSEADSAMYVDKREKRVA